MKVDITKSASANLLAALNLDNVGLNATEAQVTFGLPSVVSGTAGRNTQVTITAVANQGFAGTKDVTYTRQALVAGEGIATAKAVSVLIVAGDTDAQVLTKVATALGLVESEVSLANIVRPVDESTPGSADVVADTDSLLYTGTFAAVLTVADADVSLEDAITTDELNSFEAEG